jgi:hypothetical protein
MQRVLGSILRGFINNNNNDLRDSIPRFSDPLLRRDGAPSRDTGAGCPGPVYTGPREGQPRAAFRFACPGKGRQAQVAALSLSPVGVIAKKDAGLVNSG